MLQSVTITYLELTSREQFRPSRTPAGDDLALTRVEPPDPALNRDFYRDVGSNWYWLDRLPWSLADWRNYVAAPGLETWVLRVNGERAGYFELRTEKRDTEIVYFGLLPDFIGRGLGGYLLTKAVERAWELGDRVWLHTCNLDHPSALPAYQARGFRVFKVETKEEDLPASMPGG